MQDFLDQQADPATGRVMRKVRSFVLREGRLTKGQQNALDRHWSTTGLEQSSGPLDNQATFGRNAPLVLEIGYGMGDSLTRMAAAEPDKDFIGIEVHRPGVGALLMGVEQHQLTNVRSYCDDAVDVLRHCIPENSLARVQLYFPDPWPKKRHHKRRIVQADWLQLVTSRLQSGGILHLATDWEDYAWWMSEHCFAAAGLRNLGDEHGFHGRPDWRPLTKFEQRGQRLGHGVWDLLWEKT